MKQIDKYEYDLNGVKARRLDDNLIVIYCDTGSNYFIKLNELNDFIKTTNKKDF